MWFAAVAERRREALGRLATRFLLIAGAALLLYVGLGQPTRGRAPHRAEWITAGGVGTRVLRAGRGDTTLLFIHGYGESLLSWRLILDRFTPAYKVLALDLPGYGLSEKPDSAYDLPFYRRWLGAVLAQETAGPVIVVGHSMGGQLAAALALDHPERVAGAVLLAPSGAGITPLLTDTGSIASPAALWVATAIAFVLPIHDTGWMRESDTALAYSTVSDTLAERATRRVLERFDFSGLQGQFGGIRQPVLLLWGRHDPTIPIEIGERIAAALPCRRFVRLTTLHRPQQTVPDTVVQEMLAFLAHPGCQ